MRQKDIQHLSQQEIAHTLAMIELNGKLTLLPSKTIRTFANYTSSKNHYRKMEALKAVMAVLATCEERIAFDPNDLLPFSEIAPIITTQLDSDSMLRVRKSIVGRKHLAKKLSEVQHGMCCYCHGRMTAAIGTTQYTVEHLLERCRGGGDEATNLTAACAPCNNMRGALMRPVVEFYLLRQRLLRLWPQCTRPDVHWLRITRLLMSAHDGLKEEAECFVHVPPKEFLMARLPKL